MAEKLLITGGTGFIGYHIVEAALNHSFEVFVSTRSSTKTSHLSHFDIKYIPLNFADENDLAKQLGQERFDFVIHAAGATRAGSQEEYNLVNAAYTANLARAANDAEIPMKKFVFLSSLAVVGPSGYEAIEEDSPLNPVTDYGRSKKLAEQMLAGIPGLPWLAFRPTAVYGPRERDLLIILKTFARGFEPYMGRVDQQLSFVYAKDLAELLVTSLTSGFTGKAYNISDGNVYNRYALAEITKSLIGKKTWRFHLPMRLVNMIAMLTETAGRITGNMPQLNRDKLNELTASWNCSIAAAKRDLGYDPQYDLEKGMQETLAWYKENKWM